MDCIFVFIKIFNEFLDSAFIVEGFTSLSSFSFVFKDDFDAFIEKSHFSEAVLQSIKIEDCCFRKDFRIRPEGCLGACFL